MSWRRSNRWRWFSKITVNFWMDGSVLPGKLSRSVHGGPVNNPCR
jgi:hypothetical protein